jgi:hypothetical protein
MNFEGSWTAGTITTNSRVWYANNRAYIKLLLHCHGPRVYIDKVRGSLAKESTEGVWFGLNHLIRKRAPGFDLN